MLSESRASVWSCWTAIFCIVVTFNTWMSPQKGLLFGWIINFGGQGAIEANATYRGYTLDGYRNRCGVAAMTPSALGSAVWLQTPAGSYWGPCLVVDTVSRVDWHHSVIETGEILEIPRDVLKAVYGVDYGLRAVAYFGDCPPDVYTVGEYRPDVVIDHRRPIVQYSAWPYPSQRRIMDCDSDPQHYVESE